MPIIPNPDEMNRVNAQPLQGVASYRSGIIENAQVGLGESMMKLIGQEKDRLDKVNAQDAVAKLSQRTLDLTMGENGFVHKKGEAVVNPADGTPFQDSYKKRFGTAQEEIGKNLSGEALRQFNHQASQMSINFQMNLAKHHISESDNWEKNVTQNTFNSAATTGLLQWNNQQALIDAANEIDGAIRLQQQKLQQDPQTVEAERVKAHTPMNLGVIQGAISGGNIKYAQDYLEKNKDGVTNEGLVHAAQLIEKARIKEGEGIAMQVANQHVASFLPSMSDGMRAAAEQVYGAPVVGLEKYTKVYNGDPDKAFAALFSSQREVDQAIKKADMNAKLAKNDPNVVPTTWMSYLPPEIQDKVAQSNNAFAAGARPEKINVLQLKAQVERALVRNNDGHAVPQSVLNAAFAKAESTMGDMKAAEQQAAEEALGEIQRRADNGEITKYSDLSPSLLQRLGTHRTTAESYIKSTNDRQDKILEASDAASLWYYGMKSNPVALRDTPVSEIYKLSDELGKKRVDNLLNWQAELKAKPSTELAATVDATAFTSMAIKAGFNPNSPAHRKQLIQIQDRVEQAINARQQGGHTLTRKEKDDITAQALISYPQVKQPGAGILGTDRTGPLRGADVTTPEAIIIPEDIQKQIRDAYPGHKWTASEMRDAYSEILRSQQIDKKR